MPAKRKRGAATGSHSHSNPSAGSKHSSLVIRDLPTSTGGSARGIEANEPPSHQHETPTKKSRTTYQTPTKAIPPVPFNGTPILTRHEDRSARRKRSRQLIDRQVAGDLSDDASILDDDDDLASENGDGPLPANDDAAAQGEAVPPDLPSSTPVKRGRGRPKGWRRPPSPPPPPDLPAHEQYFYHHRPSGLRTSNNTLPAHLTQLSHETYHKRVTTYQDPHAPAINHLHALHTRAFPQWQFELNEGFSVLLHGYGSKRRLLAAFAKYIDERGEGDEEEEEEKEKNRPSVVMADADHVKFSVRGLLMTLAHAIDPEPEAPLPTSQPALLAHIAHRLAHQPPPAQIYILLSNITAPSLQHATTQSLLATLATHNSLGLLATTSLPTFPLIWPAPLLARFNFAHHDATTFVPYDDGTGTRELGGVVDSVRELLGRRGAGAKGREGVRWLLRSLPENARGLYRVLVAELLAMDAAAAEDKEDEEEEEEARERDELDLDAERNGEADGGRVRVAEDVPGVPYKTLYQKGVEEFLCSSEMAFRTLLKEFHDHQMVVSRRDASGSEVLAIPLEREELEGVLEDLTS